MNKTIKEIEQDEKQLDKVRNQLYGHMDSNKLLLFKEDLPLYLGSTCDKQPDDLQVGMLTNIRIEDGRIIGDIQISDEYIDMWKKKFDELNGPHKCIFHMKTP